MTRRIAGAGILVISFAVAFLVIRYQPVIEPFIRSITPKIALPIAALIFGGIAAVPFSITDALAVMNGTLFGPFWGSVVDTVGIVLGALLGYWLNRHAAHLLDLDKALARMPPWVKRFKVGSPPFLLAIRVIPGLGGTVATATAAAFRVPVWIHVFTMSVIAIPVCILLTVLGDKAVGWLHGTEARARMYIMHHRPHFHFRHHSTPRPEGPTS